jgi:outer membrane protein assembly factor BamE (lipoprotein component of BamABCDE complex)
MSFYTKNDAATGLTIRVGSEPIRIGFRRSDGGGRTFLKRLRFSLRALLLLTALAAAICWWCVQPKRGTITQGQASRVTEGMTEAEVVALLGLPLEREDPLASEWEYLIAKSWREPPESSLVIVFDKQGRVETTTTWIRVGDLQLLIDP